MRRVWTVTLPRDRAPEFPERCVRCLTPNPDSTFAAIARRSSGNPVKSRLAEEKVRHEVPACGDCARRLWRQDRFLLVYWIAAFLIALGISIWIHGFPERRSAEHFIVFITILPLLLPFYLLARRFPAPVSISAAKHLTEFKFRDREYAEEFRSRNVPRE